MLSKSSCFVNQKQSKIRKKQVKDKQNRLFVPSIRCLQPEGILPYILSLFHNCGRMSSVPPKKLGSPRVEHGDLLRFSTRSICSARLKITVAMFYNCPLMIGDNTDNLRQRCHPFTLSIFSPTPLRSPRLCVHKQSTPCCGEKL